MLAEERDLLTLADSLAVLGDTSTADHLIERLDVILRDPYERQRYLDDTRVDAEVRQWLANLVQRASRDVEACDALWRMKWFLMHCRLNPAFKGRAERFWYSTAPPLDDRPPSSGTDGCVTMPTASGPTPRPGFFMSP